MAARGPLILGALWAAAASLAVGTGLLAVDLVAGEVGEDVASPLDDAAVRGALSSTSPSPAATRSPHTEPDADDGPLRTVSTAGGVVSARCVEGEPRLLYATPREGYRTERAEDDDVRFMSSRKVIRVRMDCRGALLVSATTTRALDPTPEPETRSPRPEPSDDDSPEPRETEHEDHESESPSPEPRESDDD